MGIVDNGWAVSQALLVIVICTFAAYFFVQIWRWCLEDKVGGRRIWVKAYLALTFLVVARSESDYLYPSSAEWVRFTISVLIALVGAGLLLTASSAIPSLMVILAFFAGSLIGLDQGLFTVLFILCGVAVIGVLVLCGEMLLTFVIEACLSILYSATLLYGFTYLVNYGNGSYTGDSLQEMDSDVRENAGCFEQFACGFRIGGVVFVGLVRACISTYRWKQYQKGVENVGLLAKGSEPAVVTESQSVQPKAEQKLAVVVEQNE
jgi:hypothetical protein